MAQIRVTGTGQTTSAPDEAAFFFQCQGHGSDAAGALAQANGAAESVLELLESLGVPAEKRGVQRAQVYPRTRWHNDREVREGWDANTSVQCTIDDPTEAFDLLEKAAGLNGVSINGPQWQIRSDNPAHATCRQLAVEDARMKAESYAAAAGLTLGELVELTEGGASHGGPVMRAMAMEQSASLEPSEQSVQATVTLVYEAR